MYLFTSIFRKVLDQLVQGYFLRYLSDSQDRQPDLDFSISFGFRAIKNIYIPMAKLDVITASKTFKSSSISRMSGCEKHGLSYFWFTHLMINKYFYYMIMVS